MVAETVTVQLRQPFEAQERFLHCDKKRIIVRAGRRGGKTVGVSTKSVIRFLQGRRVLYGAPTIDQVATYWSEVCWACQPLIDAKLVIKNETKHTLESVSGARIRAKTCWNADTLRGDYADDLYLDEWQLMAEDTWRIVGAPMLVDNDGNATFIYTPPSLHSKSVSKADDVMHAPKMYRRAEQDTTGRWQTFHWTSRDNPHLSSDAIDELKWDMTALAIRQEIEAEDLDVIPGALWTPETIERNRVDSIPDSGLDVIGIGVDPAGSKTGHEIGIIIGGRIKIGRLNHGYIIGDYSLHGTPDEWAKRVISAYDDFEANFVVIERNYGGDMVANTIRLVAQSMNHAPVPIVEVVATRGKAVRAEPISGIEEQGRIHHVGSFPVLEDQMYSFLGGDADDRVDAKVWLMTRLVGDAVNRLKPVDTTTEQNYEALLKEQARSYRRPSQSIAGGIWRKAF